MTIPLTPTCVPVNATLSRAGRDFVRWPISGLVAGGDFTADVSVEGGPWWVLTVDDGEAVGYFAGPDYVNPAPAHVITQTSYCVLRLSSVQVTVIIPGGFILIAP
jgi:hypothetical protein